MPTSLPVWCTLALLALSAAPAAATQPYEQSFVYAGGATVEYAPTRLCTVDASENPGPVSGQPFAPHAGGVCYHRLRDHHLRIDVRDAVWGAIGFGYTFEQLGDDLSFGPCGAGGLAYTSGALELDVPEDCEYVSVYLAPLATTGTIAFVHG